VSPVHENAEGGPRQGNRLQQPASARGTSVPPGADGERTCWRCGTPFASTTEDDLRRCAGLAKAAGERERDDPLHYTGEQVIECWAGDLARLLDWLHRRAAGEAGQ
jgi:hypothetical protein